MFPKDDLLNTAPSPLGQIRRAVVLSLCPRIMDLVLECPNPLTLALVVESLMTDDKITLDTAAIILPSHSQVPWTRRRNY
jgi:hypothetical protein